MKTQNDHTQDLLDRAYEAGITSMIQMRASMILREGPEPMARLSRSLGVSTAAMTQMADEMDKRGLMTRTTPRWDRRVNMLSLTEKGFGVFTNEE